MGRKSIPNYLRRTSISVTLPPNLIERIERVTSRRSQWIETAIESRLSGESGFQTISTRRLLALLHQRVHDDEIKSTILMKWFDEELPDYGV